MFEVNIKNMNGEITHTMRLESLEKANEWINEVELDALPWGYFKIRDILKSEATEYDLTLVTEEYEHLNSLGETEIRVKTSKDYTHETLDISSEVALEELRRARLCLGEDIRSLTNRIMNMIIGFNSERSLTKEQLDDMEVSFAPILSKLLVFRPDTAKDLIELISPDGILVTEEMKSELLACYPSV